PHPPPSPIPASAPSTHRANRCAEQERMMQYSAWSVPTKREHALQAHLDLRTTTNHAFGPPSENSKPFRAGRTSNVDGPMDWMTGAVGKGSCSSFFDTRLGPCSPGSSSLKQPRNSRPPDFSTVASPST